MPQQRPCGSGFLRLAEQDPKGRDVAFDANHLGKIERGIIERPRDHYIAFAAAAPALAAPRPRAHAYVDHAGVLVRAGRIDEAHALAEQARRIGYRYGLERAVGRSQAAVDMDNRRRQDD
jgi:hypothetical protein